MATPEMLQPAVQLIELDQDRLHLHKANKLGIRQDVSSIFGKKYKPKIIISTHAAGPAGEGGAQGGGNNDSPRPFACMFCPAAFKSETSLVSHVRVHVTSGAGAGAGGGKQIVHSCVYCNRSFKQATNLEIHVRTYHPYGDGSGGPQQLNNYNMNQAALNASYMMNQALWEYKNQEQQQQGEGNSGEGQNRGADNNSHELSSQVQVKQEKGTTPQQFDAGGGTVSWEKVSPRDIHAYQVERPHRCPYCIKSFKQATHLKQHLRIHSDEKPYECTYCARRFRQKAVLNQHVRLHTGEKPYVCVQCGNTYRQLTNLKSHLNTCTGEAQPYLAVHSIWESKNGENAKPKRGRKCMPQNQYIKLEEGMEVNEKVSLWLKADQSHRLCQDQGMSSNEDNGENGDKPESPTSASRSLWSKAMSLETASKSLQQHWNASGGGKELGNTVSGVALWEHTRAMQQQQQQQASEDS